MMNVMPLITGAVWQIENLKLRQLGSLAVPVGRFKSLAVRQLESLAVWRFKSQFNPKSVRKIGSLAVRQFTI